MPARRRDRFEHVRSAAHATAVRHEGPGTVCRRPSVQSGLLVAIGGDRGWAGDIPKAMLSIKRLKELGFNVNYDSEEAVAHTARVLIKEIMG